MKKPYILIVFVSEGGSTRNLAHSVARGVNGCSGIEARIRTVPSIHGLIKKEGEDKEQEVPYVTQEDLRDCAGLAIGSPTRFGNMDSSLQYWIESMSGLWFSGGLVDKPVGVFASSASMHGGQETTLMNMLTPLLHQGMIILGVSYKTKELTQTKTGGTPYGATHVAGEGGGGCDLSDDEHVIAVAQGKRLATVALGLLGTVSKGG